MRQVFRSVRRAWGASVLLALVLVVAACSGDDAGSTGGEAAATKRTTTTTTAADPASVAARPSPGCAAGTTKVAPGDAKLTLAAAGTSGWYYRHVPPSYDGTTPLPLVIDLHGYSEPAELQKNMSELG